MMHTIRKFSLAIVIAGGLASSAFACMNDNLVVNDARDNKLSDARGNCVYTKWNDGSNTCKVKQPAKPAFAGFTQNERTIYFDFDSDKLSASAVYKLNRLLQKVQGSGMVLNASIVGHADHLGDMGYNHALSARRAHAVKNYLADHGFTNAKVMLSAQGEKAPVTTGCDKAGNKMQTINCLQPDRRVEIRFVQVK